MGFTFSSFVVLLLFDFAVQSSADLDEGVCETDKNQMELYFGTRLQVQSKIELYYTRCGRQNMTNYCYKTRQKIVQGGKVESFSEWRRKQVCCDGYQEVKPGVKPIKCQPVCNVKCVNANCTKPNVCSCLAGYGVKTSTECTPICANHCVNGECSGPNLCTCNQGFAKDEVLTNICKPVCAKNCTNGFCSSPNKCQCLAGFVKGKEDHICEPKCDEGCKNADCIAPNTCRCKEGYALDPDNKFQCYPVCIEPCVHGFCSSPNECSCYKGYVLDIYSKTICLPLCKSGCINGVCTAPELCYCNNGYMQSESYNECVKIDSELPISNISTADSYNNTHVLKPTSCSKNSSCDLNCFSNQEISSNPTDSVCYNLREVKITYSCPCGDVVKCYINITQEYIIQMVEYNIEFCDSIGFHSKIDVEIVPSEDENYCEMCYCSSGGLSYSDIHNNKTEFKLSICDNFMKSNKVQKEVQQEGIDRFLTILVISLCLVAILILAVVGYIGFAVWKHRRRVDYDMQYKERENCHENNLFEKVEDLVSDDDTEGDE